MVRSAGDAHLKTIYVPRYQLEHFCDCTLTVASGQPPASESAHWGGFVWLVQDEWYSKQSDVAVSVLDQNRYYAAEILVGRAIGTPGRLAWVYKSARHHSPHLRFLKFAPAYY